MNTKLFFFFFLLYLMHTLNINPVKKWSSAEAHSELTTTVNFYKDNSKMVTGSNDNTVKIWSVDGLNVVQTLTFADDVTHVSLRPTDNRIYVLVYDGTIEMYDPDTYTLVGSSQTHLSGAGNGNYIRFYDSYTKFVLGGYDGATPSYHKYDADTLAYIGPGASSSYASTDQITVMAMSRNQKLLASISLSGTAPFSIDLFDLTSDTLARTYSGNFGAMKWVLFSPFRDQFYSSSSDNTIKIYGPNLSGDYDVQRSFFTQSYGVPNTLNAGIQDILVSGMNENIVFLNISQVVVPYAIKSYSDQAPIFVLDMSIDQKYIVTGMQNGQVSLWEVTSDEQQTYQMPIQVIVGIALGSFIILLILICIIYHCCIKRESKKIDPDESKIVDQRKNSKKKRQAIEGQMYPSEQNSISGPGLQFNKKNLY